MVAELRLGEEPEVASGSQGEVGQRETQPLALGGDRAAALGREQPTAVYIPQAMSQAGSTWLTGSPCPAGPVSRGKPWPALTV
jgi:hypothetical protein